MLQRPRPSRQKRNPETSGENQGHWETQHEALILFPPPAQIDLPLHLHSHRSLKPPESLMFSQLKEERNPGNQGAR